MNWTKWIQCQATVKVNSVCKLVKNPSITCERNKLSILKTKYRYLPLYVCNADSPFQLLGRDMVFDATFDNI